MPCSYNEPWDPSDIYEMCCSLPDGSITLSHQGPIHSLFSLHSWELSNLRLASLHVTYDEYKK